MAKSGGFRSEAEKQKWDKIQAAGSKTIDAMLKGAVTPDDLKSLSRLVAEQHEMAGRIFDEGIASAEKTADAIVDKMNLDRIAIGKAPLTQKAHDRTFKRTFQEVISASTEDILGTIKDLLEESFAEQNDTTKKLIDDAYEKLRALSGSPTTANKPQLKLVSNNAQPGTPLAVANMIPRGGAVNDEDAVDNSVGNAIDKYFANSNNKFVKSIVELGNNLRNMVGKVSDIAASSKTLVTLKNFFTEDNPSPNEAGKHSVLWGLKRLIKAKDKAHTLDDGEDDDFSKLLTKNRSNFVDKVLGLMGFSKKDILKRRKEKAQKAQTKALASSTDARSLGEHLVDKGVRGNVAVRKAAEEAYNQMDPEKKEKTTLDKEIEKALAANEKLKDKTIAEWGKIEQARADYDEDKKAESWVRKIKGVFGDKHKEKPGWITDLLAGAALLLTNPQLITTITDAVSKYLNFQTISKFISDTWDTLKEGGTKVLSWVVDQVKDFFDNEKHLTETHEDSLTKVKDVTDKDVAKATIAPDTTVAQAQKAIPLEEALLKSAQNDLIAAHHGLLSSPSDEDYYKYKNAATTAQANIDIHTKKLRMYKDVVAGKRPPQTSVDNAVTPTSTTMGSNPASVAQATGGPSSQASTTVSSAGISSTSAIPDGSATSVATGASSSSTISTSPVSVSVSASGGQTTKSSTRVIPGDATPAAPAVTVPANPTPVAAPAQSSNSGNGSASQAISLSSFGFNSGDDTLNVYNMRMMS